MKGKLNITIRVICFIIIGLFILQFLTGIFVPKWMNPIDPPSARFYEFYSQKNNSIDVIVIGASNVGRGYSPVKVWNEYGITSYNLGTSNQTMSLAYYIFEETLKTQKPKVLVLDMDALFVDYDAPEGEYRKLFDNMKLDDVKIKAIYDDKVRAGDQLSYIFPMLRFHSRWNKLEAKDVKKSHKKDYLELSYMGMAMNCDIDPYIDTKNYMGEKNEEAKIPEENLYYVDKIINLCKEKNIDILWTEITSTTSWSLARNKATQELADKYGIKFIDYNLKPVMNESEIDLTKDTADKGNHFNVNGAEKVSKHIGKVLSEEYNCPNHKKDKTIFKKWKKISKKYKENKKKLEKNKKVKKANNDINKK